MIKSFQLPGSAPSAAEPTTFYFSGGVTYNVSLAYFVVSSFFLVAFGGLKHFLYFLFGSYFCYSVPFYLLLPTYASLFYSAIYFSLIKSQFQ
jgi:hypothetical protein